MPFPGAEADHAPAVAPPTSRGAYLRRRGFDEHCFTEGCPKCTAVAGGFTGRNHSQECCHPERLVEQTDAGRRRLVEEALRQEHADERSGEPQRAAAEAPLNSPSLVSVVECSCGSGQGIVLLISVVCGHAVFSRPTYFLADVAGRYCCVLDAAFEAAETIDGRRATLAMAS